MPTSNRSSETLELDDRDIEDRVKRHPSREQVMLDVKRCAGRLEHIREVYLHRIDEDDLPVDLTEELEMQRKSDIMCDNELRDYLDDKRPVDEDEFSQSKFKLRDQELKAKLVKLIVRLLIEKPQLHYYQGFHDVCLTYMTLEGEEESFKKLNTLVDSHFSRFMQPTMLETQELLAYIPVIVGFEDKEIKSFLDRSEAGTIFALSWVITWFSHVIPYELDVEKIFRFLERQDPHLVLYLSASIVIHKREKLLALEPEMSTVHHFLSQVPRKERLPLDELLERSLKLFERCPPEKVKLQLEKMKRSALQLDSYNLLYRFAGGIINNTLSRMNSKTAILVFVIASATSLWYSMH